MKRLIYIYDALCGWCFGFSPVMKVVAANYPDVPIEVISGGLILGDRVGPIGKVAPYIKKAFKDVEDRSGVKFGEKFIKGGLSDGSLQMNSIPPAIALAVYREEFPHRQLDFAHALHEMIYIEGRSSEDEEAMTAIASDMGYDADKFQKKLKEETYLDLAKRDFMHAQQLQVTGFPGLIAEGTDNQLYLLAKGFTPQDLMMERLEKMAQSANQ